MSLNAIHVKRRQCGVVLLVNSTAPCFRLQVNNSRGCFPLNNVFRVFLALVLLVLPCYTAVLRNFQLPQPPIVPQDARQCTIEVLRLVHTVTPALWTLN